MILAGIDEAGYGPVLGPMVLGATALRVPGALGEDVPDVWKMLKAVVSAKRDARGRKLHVADSKKVYAPGGLAALERPVLAFARQVGSHASGDELLKAIAPGCLDALARLPWYASSESLPVACDAAGLGIVSNALKSELATQDVEVVRVAAEVADEKTLNKLFAATRNKGSAHQTLFARLLDALLHAFAHEGLLVVCDRHGGRVRYGPSLRTLWPDWPLTVLSEREERADYELRSPDGKGVARVAFAEGGESLALPAALASMVAKYLRELLMARFNRYWAEQQSGIKATAGYWTDGNRFLDELAPTLARVGVAREALARAR